MYLVKLKSFHDTNPVFSKMPTKENCIFSPGIDISKAYFTNGFYEPHYIKWVSENFVNPDKEVLDIGANIGSYTLSLANKVKHVHSFECSPVVYNYLCANLILHDLSDKVTTYNTALSDVCSKAQYYLRSIDGGINGISQFEIDDINNNKSVTVPTKTLDSYEFDNINFIKLDVEGHELQVLKGAVKTLESNDYPPILFESWSENDGIKLKVPAVQLRNDLFSFINSLEYKIHPLTGSDYMFLASRK